MKQHLGVIVALLALSACGGQPNYGDAKLVRYCPHQFGDLYIDSHGQRFISDNGVKRWVAPQAKDDDVCPK